MRAQHHPDACILIVDDEASNLDLLGDILDEAGYQNVRTTSNPRQGLQWCRSIEPDLLLLDLHMPGLDGYAFLETLEDDRVGESFLPVLVLTADATLQAKQRALQSGATDFLTKPFDLTEVLLRIRNLLELRFLNRTLEERVRERTRELEEAQVEVLDRLALAGEYRDDDTGAHTARVGNLTASIAASLDLPVEKVELLRRAARLHDLGKLGVADAVLLKPGKLEVDELRLMREHAMIGARILSGSQSAVVQLAEEIALCHHERWDGQGYPRGLVGEEIPLAARIVAVADVFDALTSDRPYRRAWPAESAIAEIAGQAGGHFDPDVVAAALPVLLYSRSLPTDD